MAKLTGRWFQSAHTYNDDTVTTIKKLEIIFLTRYYGWQETHMTTEI